MVLRKLLPNLPTSCFVSFLKMRTVQFFVTLSIYTAKESVFRLTCLFFLLTSSVTDKFCVSIGRVLSEMT